MTTWVHASCECCEKLFRFSHEAFADGNVETRDLTGAFISRLFIAPTPFAGDCNDVSLGAGSVHYGVAGDQAGKTLPNGTSVWSVTIPKVNVLIGAALNRDESIMYICGEGSQVPTVEDDLFALNPNDGSITTSKRVVGSPASGGIGDVAVDDNGNVYVVTVEGDLVKFGPGLSGSGTTLFSVTDGALSSVDVGAGLNPDILIVGNDDEDADLVIDRTIWLVDSTGSVIWKKLRGASGYAAGIGGLLPNGGAALDGVGGAYIYAGLFGGKRLWKFRQSDGVELWSQLIQSGGGKLDSDATHVVGGGGVRAFVVNSSDGSVVFQTSATPVALYTSGRIRKRR